MKKILIIIVYLLSYNLLTSQSLTVFDVDTNDLKLNIIKNEKAIKHLKDKDELSKNDLRIISPNGGEIFTVGTDSIITWEGISENDTVQIEYSIDDGVIWEIITQKATGLKYIWKNIPLPESDKCLIRIRQLTSQITSNCYTEIEWEKTYGGKGSEFPVNVFQTDDSGFLVLSATDTKDGDVLNNKGESCFWLVKLDSLGNLLWQRSYNDNNSSSAIRMNQTKDGCYLLTGQNFGKGEDCKNQYGGSDAWLIKIDKAGNIIWENSYGSTEHEYGVDIFENSEGNLILVGNKGTMDSKNQTDFYIIKTDNLGNILWERNFGGSKEEEIYSVRQTPDGGYILIGYTESKIFGNKSNFGLRDCFVLKLDANGFTEWSKTFGGEWDEIALKVMVLADSSYLIGGITGSKRNDITNNMGLNDIWLINISKNGDLIRQKTLGGSDDDYLFSMELTENNQIIFCGFSNSFDFDLAGRTEPGSIWAGKTDITGNIIWQKSLGKKYGDRGNSIQNTNDGGYIIAGINSDRDLYIIKLSPEKYILEEDVSDAEFSVTDPKVKSFDIDMGQVIVWNTKDSVITGFIKNNGLYKFSIDSIFFTGTDFDAFSFVPEFIPFILDKNESKDVGFRFIPNRTGMHEAIVNIKINSKIFQQKIQGEGIKSDIELLTKKVDFGKVYVDFTKDTNNIIALRNAGSSAIEISDIHIIQKTDYNFSIMAGNENKTLNPNDTLFMNLRFAPDFAGFQEGFIEFNFNRTGSPIKLNLYGEGIIGGKNYLKLEVLNAEAYPSKNVKLIIRAKENNNFNLPGVSTIRTELNFNPTILTPLDFQIQISDDKNAHIIIEDLPVNFKAGDTIASIWFKVGLGNSEECRLELSNTEIIGGQADISVESGTFHLLGICYEGGARLLNPNNKVELLKISPNPNDGNLAVELNLLEKGLSTLIVYNSNGELMFEKNLSVTTGKIDLNISTKEFANGLYFVSLQTPTIRKVEQLVVFK